jgi:ketosteroid isomerase-like protein
MSPKEVVTAFFESAAIRDKSAVGKFLSPDVIWNDNGPEEMKGGGNFTNSEEVMNYIWGNFRDTRNLKIVPIWMISEGNKVVVLIREEAILTGTERFYRIHSIHVYTVKNGRITNFDNYFDSMPLLKALYDIKFYSPGVQQSAGTV